LEYRLDYNFAIRKLNDAMDVGFDGSPGTTESLWTRSRGNSVQGDVGVKVNTGGIMDAFINYDLDASRGYHSHNGSLGLGFEF
jgi:hypothetical protein